MANQDDASNPLFLHPSDHPGLLLVSQPLTEDNYYSWHRSMKLALNGKNKFGYVDGSFPWPEDADDRVRAIWKRNDDIVCSWLLNSVSKDIVSSIPYDGSSAAVWLDLKNRFKQTNGPRTYQLRKNLVSLSQGSLSITQYYTKLKSVWEELQEFKPQCNCVCGGVRPLLECIQLEYVLVFLMGLNDSFSHIRCQILAMNLIPQISKAFSLVIQDEKQREIGASSSLNSESQAVFAVESQSGKPNGKKDRPVCTHCELIGDTKDRCYKNHGYPPGYKSKAMNSTAVHQVSGPSDSISPNMAITADQCKMLLSLLSSQLAHAAVPCATEIPPNESTGPQSLKDDWQG